MKNSSPYLFSLWLPLYVLGLGQVSWVSTSTFLWKSSGAPDLSAASPGRIEGRMLKAGYVSPWEILRTSKMVIKRSLKVWQNIILLMFPLFRTRVLSVFISGFFHLEICAPCAWKAIFYGSQYGKALSQTKWLHLLHAIYVYIYIYIYHLVI